MASSFFLELSDGEEEAALLARERPIASERPTASMGDCDNRRSRVRSQRALFRVIWARGSERSRFGTFAKRE